MTTPLLTTKLYIPPPRPKLVERPHLIERLDEGLRLGHRLTLLAAPAGFGKTTLLGEWIYLEVSSREYGVRQGYELAGKAPPTSYSLLPTPCFAWLSLDEGDNDPARFFAYLVAALRQIDASMGEVTLSLLSSPQMPPAESLATTLANDMATIPTPFVLVLDDYQLIHTSLIHDALAFLLDHQPPRMHVVIATRTDPPLPLPRLRARGQMTEIRADDLRFTEEEAATFLDRALGLPLEAEDITALEARTEGWIAGLQLAALSMRGKKDIAGFIEAFSGSSRHVIDYLAEEVLAQQPEEIRDFLHQTSILDRFCAPLCDAVRKAGESTDRRTTQSPRLAPAASQAILEHLERQNLFLVPLDDRREWYRYHRLFADFLRTGLKPEQAATLNLRAARWFEAHDLLPEAVKYSLAHAAATGDTDEAVRVVILAGSRALSEGALVTLLGWLDALPDEVVCTNGWLASFKAWSLLMTGQSEMATSYIQSAEANLEDDAAAVDRGRVLSLRCAISDAKDVLQMAPQALELIGDADPLSRTGLLFILGDAQDAVGNVAGADETFREAYDLGQRHGHQIMAAVALSHLALSTNYQGRRREALALCQRGVEQYTDTRGNPLPAAGLLYVVLGELAYELNELEEACRYLQKGLELGRQSATTLVILYGLETLARVQAAMGHGQEALATIRADQTLSVQAGELEWHNAAASIEANLLLRQGDVRAAQQWVESIDLPLADFIDQTRKYEYTNYVRVLLALDRAREAQTLLAKLERAAREDGRRRHLLTIHIQQALAEHSLGNKVKALEYLEQALCLAAPEDYVRAFLDEGPAVTGLVVKAKHVAPAFVDKVLAAFGGSPPPPHAPTLVETLSERELEILRLLVTDLSAPEIAEELVVAVSTVRSHLKHIYGKLGARSRYEAVERAKTLGLL
ncbi:MAG: tetratricopeptide repeat protein [Thermoflexales bacterium]|nr:tetratricopeptide repeat protein [Thermoflexales bacterium]